MKDAFTLLEMVVVLAVAAVLAHLTVRELGQYRDIKLEKSADLQLEEIREASRRFFLDVGRLPRLTPQTNDAGVVAWTLSELWKRPPSLCRRRLVNEDGVSLAVGWQGPYLRMPFGRDRLLDPWGNPIELEDAAHLRRLWADANGAVTNICHYGPAGQEFGRRNMPLVPDGGLFADVVLTVDAADYSGEVRCSLHGAYENHAAALQADPVSAGSQIVFSNVPCGPKVLKIVAGKTSARRVDVHGPVTEIGISVK